MEPAILLQVCGNFGQPAPDRELCLRGKPRHQPPLQGFDVEPAYLTYAVASINVWNRLGVAYRWTPPARQKAADAAAS